MKAAARKRMESFLDALFKWNDRASLTAFANKKEAWRLGVEPSLVAVPALPAGTRVLDIGSGGGFPALCLAIAGTRLSFICAEPSLRKSLFLQRTSAELELDVEVEVASADEVLRKRNDFRAVTVRGVRLRRGLVKRLARALPEGGVLLVWSGGDRLVEYRRWMKDEGFDVEVRPTGPTDSLLLVGCR